MNTAHLAEPETPARRALLIEAEKVRTTYRSTPGAFAGSTIAATLMGGVLYGVVDTRVLVTWVAAVYVLTLMRFVLWRRYQRTQPPPALAHRWGVYATVLYGLSGTLWGVGNIVLFAPDNFAYQLFMLFGTIGLGLGAAYAQVSYLPTFYAFLYPALTLAALVFLKEGDRAHVILGIMALVYLPITTRFVQNLHHSFVDSVKLRFENLDLIEDLRRQKQAAEAANVAKSRFLAAASHDLRQPLHALSLFVQTLQESTLPESERTTVANVRRSVDAMEELFNALLDVSKLDAGIVPVNLTTVPLRPIVERVTSDYLAVANGKGLQLRVRCAPLFVRTDPVLLERIVRNLVANAVRHTQRGAVLIACRRRGRTLQLQVWDTGPGIPADKQHDIFQEFTQLGNPERDRGKGLGLGLAIVDRLSRLLRHPVELRSRLGHGSVFAVTLPRGEASDYAPVTPNGVPGMHDFTGALVFVVDDEIAVLEGMTDLLRRWGCEVLSAGSYVEAMEKLAAVTRVPDLIISDYRLRGNENGIHLVETLRHEFNAEIPALLVTGDTGPDRLREAQASRLPILHKPLNPARLRTLMSSLLRQGDSEQMERPAQT